MNTVPIPFACLFPGQGSQSVGMLDELASVFPDVQTIFARASNALGYDVWQLTHDETRLHQTEYTQPALLVAGVAVFKIFEQHCPTPPLYVAGHSLGEYTALVCANAMTLEDAARLVQRRGRLMQEAVPLGEGAMAAIIGLSDEDVASLCKQCSKDSLMVTPANYNATGQVVIAGHVRAVEDAMALAEQQGARLAKKLPVSVPCHGPLLKPAAKKFMEALQETPIQSPSIPVLANVDVSIHHNPDDIRTSLMQQLYSPVLWVDIIKTLAEKNLQFLLECGPNKVLTGLGKRITRDLKTYPMGDSQSLQTVINIFEASIGD